MPSERPTVHAVPDLPPGSVRRVWLAVGSDGWARLPLIVIRGAEAGPRVVVVAGQHGDEGYGMLAVQRVVDALDPSLLRGTVIASPCLNVHAWCHGTRVGPFDGVDMNRVHPGDRGGSATQQLAAALHEALLPGADLVVDVHGGSAELGDIAFATLTRGNERDPVAVDAFEAALGVPRMLEVSDPSAVPMGRLADHAGATRFGILGIEACSVRATTTANVDQMASYVRRALVACGALPQAESDTAPPPERVRTAGVRASAFGLFVPTVDFGDLVDSGQHLGVMVDLFGDEVQRVEAPAGGRVLVLRTGVWARPGHLLVVVGSAVHA